MFNLFKKKEVIYAPIVGEVVKSREVPDPVFKEEMMGKGVAIKPTDNKIYAPFDGVVAMVFKTKHALGLTSNKGTEVLIHIGLDTVNLNGECFDIQVSAGQVIKKGEILGSFDIEGIKAHELETIVPVVITNLENKKITRYTDKMVTNEDIIIELD